MISLLVSSGASASGIRFGSARYSRLLFLLVSLFAGLAVMLGATAQAFAASGAIDIVLTQHKVVRGKDGKERLLAAANVLPGDIVEYRAVYRNVSQASVTGLLADLPIPEGLEYIEGTATPTTGLTAASVKVPSPAAYAALPLVKRLPDGRILRVPFADYRALRWTVGKLAPGAQFVIRARAKVIALPVPAPAARKVIPQAPPARTSTRP